MNGQRNGWQGWVALLLAGFALFVAFGSRSNGMMGFQPGANNYTQRNWMMPQAPQLQQAPQGQNVQPQVPSDIQGATQNTQRSVGRGRDRMQSSMMQGGMMQGSMMQNNDGAFNRNNMRSSMLSCGFMAGGLLGMLGGILKLLGLATLAWLAIRFFSRRHQGTQPVTAQPIATSPDAPREHDPRVE